MAANFCLGFKQSEKQNQRIHLTGCKKGMKEWKLHPGELHGDCYAVHSVPY